MQMSAQSSSWDPRAVAPVWYVVGDVVAALVVVSVAVVAIRLGQSPPTVATVLSIAAAATVVALRRRYPRAAPVAVVLIAALGLPYSGPAPAYLVAGLITLFTVAANTDRRTTAAFAIGCAVGATTLSLLFPPVGWNGIGAVAQQLVQIGFAAAAGDATRSRRAYIEAVTERARRAEASKESEARRRVAEERLNIARDLHDVVAHQIAVINLHAGVASESLRRNGTEVEQSLATIRAAARTVLGDIASLLTVLRAADPTADGDQSVSVPVPGLAGLESLVTEFARSGLDVEVREVGDRYPLPEAVDVVAYRVIQEALTNAQKHGADHSALLQIEYDAASVEITVTNTTDSAARGRDSGRAGLGLVGARERVAAVHGTLLTAYGPGQVHRLTARLPTQAVTEQPDADDHQPLGVLPQGAP